jgi:AraC-like DNA-binding protein
MLPLAKPTRRQIETPPANVLMLEQHYSVAEIAERWNMSHNYVLERFQDEPGVVRTQGKKGHIRIPASVLERVYKELISGSMAR